MNQSEANAALHQNIVLNEQIEHQTIPVTVTIGQTGRVKVDFTTPSSCDKILGFAIPEPIGGWSPDKIKLGLQRKSGNTIFETVDVLMFVTNRSVEVGKRYVPLHTDAKGSEMEWIVELPVAATANFTFDISVVLVRRKS